jgi:hypothetical protein
MKKFIPALVFTSLLFAACYNDKADKLYPAPATCDTTNVTYAATVSPVMATNCALSGCHNTATSSGGVALDNYTGVKNATSGGRLVGTISHATGFVQMPKNMAKLDDCTIAKISAWVNKGALNN